MAQTVGWAGDHHLAEGRHDDQDEDGHQLDKQPQATLRNRNTRWSATHTPGQGSHSTTLPSSPPPRAPTQPLLSCFSQGVTQISWGEPSSSQDIVTLKVQSLCPTSEYSQGEPWEGIPRASCLQFVFLEQTREQDWFYGQPSPLFSAGWMKVIPALPHLLSSLHFHL